MTANPIIKWAGGKTRMLDLLQPPPTYARFIEPFLGGGARFLSLDHTGHQVPLVSDSNTALMLFYKLIGRFPDQFVEQLKKLTFEYEIQPDKKAWYLSVREEFNDWLDDMDMGIDEVSYATIFYAINKLCFNGLYRVNNKGGYNVGYGSPRSSIQFDEENFRAASSKFRLAGLASADYIDVIATAQAGDWAFMDPPYLDTFAGYTEGKFSTEDHHELSREVRNLDSRGVHFILTNTDCLEVRHLYEGFTITSTTQNNAINSKPSGRKGGRKEVIISNYHIDVKKES